MSRRIQDRNLLVWEVYPSGGQLGLSTDPYLVFNCLTQRGLRPRRFRLRGDEAEAQRIVEDAPDGELQTMLRQSSELP